MREHLCQYWPRYVRALLFWGALGAFIGVLTAPPGPEWQLMQAETRLAEAWQKQSPLATYRELLPTWQQLAQNATGSAEQRSRAWQGWGDCLFAAEQFAEAVECYKEALRWDSANAQARIHLKLALDRCPKQNSAPPSQQTPPASKAPQQKPSPTPPSSPPTSPSPAQPSPAAEPPGSAVPRNSAPNATGNGDDQVLRHLIEQEQERRRASAPSRQIPPPRGSEIW